MNNENLKEIQGKPFDKKGLKECFLFKGKKRGYDILTFFLNATWKENKDGICFVMLNDSEIFGIKSLEISDEKRIEFLWLFFLMRKKGYFNYSEEILEKLLKGKYLELFRCGKKLEERIKKYGEFVVDFEKYSQYSTLGEGGRVIKFCLIFKKHKFKVNENGEKIKWQEWETLTKASFAYDFDLLGEVICNTISCFSEKGEIEELSANEDNKFETEFDIDPKNVPDISIASEKISKKIGIEVVEVHSCSLKVTKEGGKESFINFIQKQLNERIKESVEKHEVAKLESIKSYFVYYCVGFFKEWLRKR